MNPCYHPPAENHHPSPVRVIGRNIVEPPRADDFRSSRDQGDGDVVVDLVLDQARYFLFFRCLPASSLRQLPRLCKGVWDNSQLLLPLQTRLELRVGGGVPPAAPAHVSVALSYKEDAWRYVL